MSLSVLPLILPSLFDTHTARTHARARAHTHRWTDSSEQELGGGAVGSGPLHQTVSDGPTRPGNALDGPTEELRSWLTGLKPGDDKWRQAVNSHIVDELIRNELFKGDILQSNADDLRAILQGISTFKPGWILVVMNGRRQA